MKCIECNNEVSELCPDGEAICRECGFRTA